MFMKKLRKNLNGDSLIEVIVAFAIVSIVGLITIAGVITSGRIKIQTAHIKNASLVADEILQNGGTKSSLTSDSDDYPIKIYNLKYSEYKTATDADKTDKTLESIKGSKYSAVGTDGVKTQTYKYYDTSVTGSTDKKDDTKGQTGGKGNFGMSGQWFMRFYLDPTVTLPDKFYVELRLKDGETGASGTIDANKTSCTAGGIMYYYQESNKSNKSVSWFYGSNGGTVVNLANDGIYVNEGSGIFKYNGENISFSSDGELSFYWLYDTTAQSDFCVDEDFQIFDIAFYWSSLTAYNIELHIIDADNTSKEYLASDGSSCMDRITVHSRDFGVGTKSYDYTGTGNWYRAYSNPCSLSGEDYSTGYNGTSGWVYYPEPQLSDKAREYIGEQSNGHNAIYNYDNLSQYIYQWTKGHDGAESTEEWEDEFSDTNKRYMLSLGEFGKGKGENSFVDGVQKFRNYARTNNEDYYTDFTKWVEECGYGRTSFEDLTNGTETKFYYTYWVYYILEIEKVRSNPNAELGDASTDEIAEGISSYYAYAFKEFNNSATYSDEIAKLFYWWKYDSTFYGHVKDFLATKGYTSISQVSEFASYIDAVSMYYYTDILKENYTEGTESYSSYESLYNAKRSENLESGVKQIYKDVYYYFIGQSYIDARTDLYNDFIKPFSGKTQESTFKEVFDAVKTMSTGETAEYINSNYKNNTYVTEIYEMIIYIFSNDNYNKFKSWMSGKSSVDFSDTDRYVKDSNYIEGVTVAWTYFCLDVAGTRTGLTIGPESSGVVSYGTITSFESYHSAYESYNISDSVSDCVHAFWKDCLGRGNCTYTG